MIVRSHFRRAGGVAAHLQRADHNEDVILRDDLNRVAPSDLEDALRLFVALARTNARTKRDLIHVKISPDHAMTEIELEATLNDVEREHRIAPTVPRFVVEHAKGNRARHFHVVYPMVDPATGQAIRSAANYLADEIVSRLGELRCGEPITPGPRQSQVVQELRRRGFAHEADRLETYHSVPSGRRIEGPARQQANDLGVDLERVRRQAFEAWLKNGDDWSAFQIALAAHGLVIARGDKAVLLVDQPTGAAVPLARALRQSGKEAGIAALIRERDLREAFAAAPDFPTARNRGLSLAKHDADLALQREFDLLAREAMEDGRKQLAERLQKLRWREREKQRKCATETLRSRRATIRAAYARRDRVRRARVSRAFLAADMLGDGALRKLAFLLAGTAVLLAGGGLGLALISAGVALSALPSRELARAAALQTRLERAQDMSATDKALAAAHDKVRGQFGALHVTIDFARIPKAHRGLAGILLHLYLKEHEHGMSPSDAQSKAAIIRVLGADVARDLEACLVGNGRTALTILSWYDHNKPSHRQAVRIALGQTETGAEKKNEAKAVSRSRGTRLER